MTSFEGGPADGVVLSLRSSPELLRVTFNPRARKYPWDALDMPEDEAAPHEVIHVYERVGEPFWYHVKGSKAIRGYWPKVTYRPLFPTPDGELVRTTDAWRAFCISHTAATGDHETH